MTKALFLVGAPGLGKTTVARGVLGMRGAELPPGGYLVPSPKWTVTPEVVAAGHYTGATFDGADTIPAPSYKDALAYWARHLSGAPLTLFDGDRFSHKAALEFVSAVVGGVLVVHLLAPPAVGAARRSARGTSQNQSWVAGRVTKAANFARIAREVGARVVELDASASAAEVLLLVNEARSSVKTPPQPG